VSRAAAIRLGALAVVVALWELTRQFDLVNPILLAAPSEIYKAIAESGGQFLVAFQLTLAEIAVAIAITWGLGIGFGLACGALPGLGLAAGPILAALFAIPLIVWYPLFMVWVGIGPASKVLFAVVSGFFPIALNTLYGVRLLDRRFITFGRAVGASRMQLVFRILVPLALPSVVSGLRIGTALVVIGVVVTEMLASLGGVGFWISYHRTLFNTGHVYLGILLALACALLVNWGLTRMEARYGRWRALERAEA
jgi:NitT/TauT family transport system permease protein/taurine transport system permease protein